MPSQRALRTQPLVLSCTAEKQCSIREAIFHPFPAHKVWRCHGSSAAVQALFRRGQLKALVDVHGAQSGMGGFLTPDEVSPRHYCNCGALLLATS